MTGKELILKTLSHEKVDRPPWVPYAGVHAGKLVGYDATEVLQDADKLYEALAAVKRLYVPDGMPITFDLQLEAEILGCELMWAKDNPPSVTSHPLADTDEIPEKIIDKDDGRVPIVLDVMRRIKADFGDDTAIYGLYCGPFTLASHLRGTKLFMDMKRNPEHVKKLIDYCTDQAIALSDLFHEAGSDVLGPVDPLVSQISAKHFNEFLAEPYTRIFDHIRSLNLKSCFFVCGNAERNLEVMALTKPDNISIDENIAMDRAKKLTDQYNIALGGNIPLTTTMLFGNQQDNMKFVVDMVDSLDVADRNLVVSPGCDMPYDIPIENTIAVTETVRDLNLYRELIKNYESTDIGADVTLPDYDNLERPLIEAFTLDSASCAACTYMWATACDAKTYFGDRVDVVEHKYTNLEGVATIKKMGVQNLPSLYMNGKLVYASIIPSNDECFAEIEKLLVEFENK